MAHPPITLGGSNHSCHLLMVIPGSVNYFYNVYARWMAEAFERLGARVVLCELPDVPPGTYDLCILSNAAEILHATRAAGGWERLANLRRAVGTLISFSAECAYTPWFQSIVNLGRELEVDALLDVGFVPQRESTNGLDADYYFVFDGLLDSQAREQDPAPCAASPTRNIPWVHVGMHTGKRVELTDQLVKGFSPHGLFYLPPVSPIKEKGTPHLNQGHMERILTRAKYYIWRSHHDYFFMESLRYKMSWLAGCLPIKVVGDEDALPADCPFSAWVLREAELIERLRAMEFDTERRAFHDEYLRRPRLEEGLARVLEGCGYAASGHAANPAEDAGVGESFRRCA
jgi:hypothetical protein